MSFKLDWVYATYMQLHIKKQYSIEKNFQEESTTITAIVEKRQAGLIHMREEM